MANGEPTLPRNAKSPLGETKRVKRAVSKLNRGIRSTRDWMLERIGQIPNNVVGTTNTADMHGNRNIYEYLIDANALRQILSEARQRLESNTLGTVQDEAENAYTVGTANEAANLSGMTEDYTRTINQIVASQPFQSRVAFIRSRVFEEMEGFYGQTAADLSRTLGDALDQGLAPTRVAQQIKDRFGVSMSRAERIARTEINQAQRRGGWDEAQDAEERLGIRTKEMHLSALSPTSRSAHIARHGRLYTREEVRAWYGRDANGINCKCSQVSVQVDADGNPLTTKAIDRARQTKDNFTK